MSTNEDNDEFFDGGDVVDVELEIIQYRFTDEVIKKGIYIKEDVHIIFTIENRGFDDFNCGEQLQIRQNKDDFFRNGAVAMKGLTVPSTGTTEFTFVMKVIHDVRNLNKLPERVTIEIINRNRDVIASVVVTIPIDLYVLGLKRKYKPMNVLLFGQVGMGKSSFINTVATVFNENPDFKHRVMSYVQTGKSAISLTRSLQSHKFGNLRIFDTWGWEKTDENANQSYSKDFFKRALLGLLPENIHLDTVSNFDITEDHPDIKQELNKIDVVIFFVTPINTSDEYLTKVREFQGVCGDLKVKSMVLLTQIDVLDAVYEKDPYCNIDKIEELLDKISADTALDKSNIKPIVNYVRTSERIWALDRACFVPISHCFMLAQPLDNV